MAVVTGNKTDKILAEVLREVREVRALVEPISRVVKASRGRKVGAHLVRPFPKNAKAKKLSAGLRQALREVKEGKLVGPFDTVADLMADLNR